MLYISTRSSETYTAARTLTADNAPDGGLFVPFQMPMLTLDDLRGKTQAECKAKLDEKLAEIRKGIYVQPDKMTVEGVIKDSKVEVFPFILEMDRYMLGLSGVQNMDMSYKYHASLIKSPFLIKLGMDVYGDDFDNMKFKIGKAKYKSTNVPVFSSVIDTTKINLVSSIRGIFEKGVEAAVAENERNEAIEKHKQEIGYVRAVDQELEALSKKEEEQIKAEEEVLKTQEKAEEALGEAIRQINLDLTSIQNTEKKTE